MPHKHVPGLVLHLDPTVLLAQGATFSCSEEAAVKDQHFFLCIGADAKAGTWVPLYSAAGVGRVEITPEQKEGHAKWTAVSSYFRTGQAWKVPHKAVARTALAGHDKSTPKTPNTVALTAVPAPSQFAL